MKFKTVLTLPPVLVEIAHPERFIMMGSCFTECIGGRMLEEKFNCLLNPFGILFNPVSIVQALQRIGENQPLQKEELIFHNELWHSLMHHGSFSSPHLEEALQHMNTAYTQAVAHYKDSNLLILTWGTSYVYTYKKNGTVAGNCHKLPAQAFERHRISLETLTETYEIFIKKWLSAHPDGKIILTVSPVRHIRDGLHENQLSKAVLLLAADALVRRFPTHVFYFPAYEILMDELRDYRFYDSDMLHPSELAAEYIYARFGDCCFPATTQQASRACRELTRMLQHRPMHRESEGFRTFKAKIENKIRELESAYPYLSLQKEIQLCQSL